MRSLLRRSSSCRRIFTLRPEPAFLYRVRRRHADLRCSNEGAAIANAARVFVVVGKRPCSTASTVDDGARLIDGLDAVLSDDELDETALSQLSARSLNRMDALSDQQMRELLSRLAELRSRFGDVAAVVDLHRRVDAELRARAPHWSFAQFLVFFDLFTRVPRLQRSAFVSYAMKHRLQKIFAQERTQIVEFARLINRCNCWRVYHVRKFGFEAYVAEHLDQLASHEIDVFLECMLKLRLLVSTPLLFEKLSHRLLVRLPDASPDVVALSAQFVCLQLMLTLRSEQPETSAVAEGARQLLDHLTDADNAPLCGYVEAGRLCLPQTARALRYDSRPFFRKFASKFLEHREELPLLAICDALECFVFFDQMSASFSLVYERVVEGVRSDAFATTIAQHPPLLVRIVYYLSMVGIYPADLVDRVFDPCFLRTIYKKRLDSWPLRGTKVRGQSLLTIDGGLRIECPSYDGHRLAPEVRSIVQRYFCWALPKLLVRGQCNSGGGCSSEVQDDSGANGDHNSQSDSTQLFCRAHMHTTLLYRIRCSLDMVLGGPEFSHTCFALPHLRRPNLIFALCEDTGKVWQLPEQLRQRLIVDKDCLEMVEETVARLRWFTFGVMVTVPGIEQPMLCGDEIAKVRQLEKLGFKVLRVPHREWMLKSQDEMSRALRAMIFAGFDCSKQKSFH